MVHVGCTLENTRDTNAVRRPEKKSIRVNFKPIHDDAEKYNPNGTRFQTNKRSALEKKKSYNSKRHLKWRNEKGARELSTLVLERVNKAQQARAYVTSIIEAVRDVSLAPQRKAYVKRTLYQSTSSQSVHMNPMPRIAT